MVTETTVNIVMSTIINKYEEHSSRGERRVCGGGAVRQEEVEEWKGQERKMIFMMNMFYTDYCLIGSVV